MENSCDSLNLKVSSTRRHKVGVEIAEKNFAKLPSIFLLAIAKKEDRAIEDWVFEALANLSISKKRYDEKIIKALIENTLVSIKLKEMLKATLDSKTCS